MVYHLFYEGVNLSTQIITKYLIFAILFVSSPVFAMEFNWGQLVQTFPSLPESALQFKTSGAPRCSEIFSVAKTSLITQLKIGGINPSSLDPHSGNVKLGDTGKIETIMINHDAPVEIYRQLFKEAMLQWLEKGYTHAQEKLLWDINEQLVPYRVQWIQYRFGDSYRGAFPHPLPKEYQGIASLRIFDSSTSQKVLGIKVNYEGTDTPSASGFKDPIELSPKNQAAHYQLPRFGRPEGLPVYRWHFGIGTNQKGFTSGLLSMFSHMAQGLDNFYNNAHFKTFKTTDRVDDLGMVIYSSVKPSLLSYYLKLGFEVLDPLTGEPIAPVIQGHRNGQGEIVAGQQTLPDGMILFGMKAGDFLKRFYEQKQVPDIVYETPDASFRISGNTQTRDSAAENVFFNGNLKAFDRVDKVKTRREYLNRLTKVEALFLEYAKSIQMFVHRHPEVYKMDRPEVEFFTRNQEWKDLILVYRKFALNFYSFVNNTPRSIRNSNWDLAEQMARNNLTEYPLEAWNSFEANTTKTRLKVFEALEALIR